MLADGDVRTEFNGETEGAANHRNEALDVKHESPFLFISFLACVMSKSQNWKARKGESIYLKLLRQNHESNQCIVADVPLIGFSSFKK